MPGAVHYATAWRPSGGAGLAWQPGPRLLFGTRVILNHDEETRTDALGTTQGLARSYEFRLGGSVAPWPGGIVDLGGTALYRRNGLTGATTTTVHPNVGLEQTFLGKAVVLRAGVDETSYGGGLTLRRRPLQLDVAYVYDLGRARVGNIFGTTSNSVLATLTFDIGWRPAPPPAAQPAAPSYQPSPTAIQSPSPTGTSASTPGTH
jgi:hypothetical protein